MWAFEHSSMLLVALFLNAYLIWCYLASSPTQNVDANQCQVNYLRAIVALLISQIPFWVGATCYFITGVNQPIEVNMVLSLATGLTFITWAHRNGQAYMAFLALLFAVATGWDIYTSLFGSNIYMQFHEALHYIAIIIIAGRGHASSVHMYLRNSLRAVAD